MEDSHKLKHILRDILIICMSIGIAYFLANSNLSTTLLEYDGALRFLVVIILGAMFTTLFTLAPASVGLIEISDTTPIILVATLGAVGAMIIDSIVVSFVKKDITRDLRNLSRFSFKWHFISLFHFGFLKWLSFVFGIFVISSPLPDELGLFLIGISKVKSKYLPLIFFLAHFIGIYILLSIAEKVS